MGLFIALIAVGILIIVVSIVAVVVQRNKRIKAAFNASKMNPPIQRALAQEAVVPSVLSLDHQKFEKFISEYDDGSLQFPNLDYRKGARHTCGFGLAEGFQINKEGNMEWGYVRIHSGTDRARGLEYKGIKDIVICPFDFQRTNIIDYAGKGYGSLIQLWQDEYEFEMRIAHMHPQNDIISWSLQQFRACKPFKRNWFIGKAGNYGDSSGAHTHTEFLSIDEKSEVLEILLEELYGDAIYKEYTTSQILSFYKKQAKFVDASDKVILDDWTQLKKIKMVHFANKYLYRYTNTNGKQITKYASNMLFKDL